jgi:hypothetical protein
MAHSGSVRGDMAVFDNMRAVGKGVRRGGRLQRRTRHNHLPNEVADLGKQRGRPGGSTGLASDCRRSAQERRVRRWLQRTHSGTARANAARGAYPWGWCSDRDGFEQQGKWLASTLTRGQTVAGRRRPGRPISTRHVATQQLTGGSHAGADF